ncbi:hypothetical protein ABZ070_05340 [Streptomyces sp. NPDC006283]|uniref:hypothetical protein n=1 Tax=Streptomyces sp. NPDC006283 TaxID=3156741 RepID=UPI0033BCC167
MRELLNAAFGFPAMLFTAAVIVVAGFWLLVLFRLAERDCFDSDVDAKALGLDGVPVSVTVTLSMVVGWLLSVGGSVLLARVGLPGVLSHLLSTALLLVAPLLSWLVTRQLVRPLSKLFPDDSGLSRQDVVGLSGPPERDRSTVSGQCPSAAPVRQGR